jgi:hypothetical protein
MCTPPELRNSANIAKEFVIPSKSRKRYELAYQQFKDWLLRKNVGSLEAYSENVFLAYFQEEKSLRNKAPNTLWSEFSMIKKMLSLKENVELTKNNYPNLFALLKTNSKGYQPKKAAVFQDEDVVRFMQNASDDEYLSTKVCFG